MEIEELVGRFRIEGTLTGVKGNKQGHINSTYICTVGGRKYTIQRINRSVFRRPGEVMENILRVTSHIRGKIASLPDADRRVLTVIPSRDGKPYVLDEEGEYWRAYLFIDSARTYDTIADEKQAYLLGGAIGNFQNQLSDFDGSTLHTTIPDFHNMAFRYTQLEAAAAADVKGRLSSVKEEYRFLRENRERGCRIWDGMKSGLYPVRVTHNDTKMNNVLFSEDGSEALCVIDLDTVMPGTILFDTGDMIRTSCSSAEEDEKDAGKVEFIVPFYKALIKGYEEKATFLTADEKGALKESGRTITQIMAVRFLTDYLAGDTYYKTAYPEHNIVRARTQIALMKSMDRQWGSY